MDEAREMEEGHEAQGMAYQDQMEQEMQSLRTRIATLERERDTYWAECEAWRKCWEGEIGEPMSDYVQVCVDATNALRPDPRKGQG